MEEDDAVGSWNGRVVLGGSAGLRRHTAVMVVVAAVWAAEVAAASSAERLALAYVPLAAVPSTVAAASS